MHLSPTNFLNFKNISWKDLGYGFTNMKRMNKCRFIQRLYLDNVWGRILIAIPARLGIRGCVSDEKKPMGPSE